MRKILPVPGAQKRALFFIPARVASESIWRPRSNFTQVSGFASLETTQPAGQETQLRAKKPLPDKLHEKTRYMQIAARDH